MNEPSRFIVTDTYTICTPCANDSRIANYSPFAANHRVFVVACSALPQASYALHFATILAKCLKTRLVQNATLPLVLQNANRRKLPCFSYVALPKSTKRIDRDSFATHHIKAVKKRSHQAIGRCCAPSEATLESSISKATICDYVMDGIPKMKIENLLTFANQEKSTTRVFNLHSKEKYICQLESSETFMPITFSIKSQYSQHSPLFSGFL